MKKIFLIVIFAVLVGFLYYFAQASIENRFTKTLIQRVAQVNPTPAGEIVQGFEISQTIQLTDSMLARSRNVDGPVFELCVKVMLANYSDRENKGQVKVSLTGAGENYEKIIDVRRVRDNAYHKICFPVDNFAGFSGDELELTLVGMEGKPGSSITAWLNEDISQGEALVNGVNTNKALAFSIEVSGDRPGRSTPAFYLLFIYIAMLAGLFILLAPGDVSEKYPS